MEGWPARLRAEAANSHSGTRGRERTSEMEELANDQMAGLEDSSVVDCSLAEDGNVQMQSVE